MEDVEILSIQTIEVFELVWLLVILDYSWGSTMNTEIAELDLTWRCLGFVFSFLSMLSVKIEIYYINND